MTLSNNVYSFNYSILGKCDGMGRFSAIGFGSIWWSSTRYFTVYAGTRCLGYDESVVHSYAKSICFSIFMKKIIITACVILLIVGCKQEEEKRLSVLQKDNMEIGGVLPAGEEIATRTTLDSDGLLTLWEEGDAIGVYGNGQSNVSLTLTSGAGTPFGVFSGAQTGIPEGAYYPYTASAGDNYHEVHGFLDYEQVQDENVPMIAPYDWKISTHITVNDQEGYRIHFREIMTMLDISIDVSGTALVGETLGSVTLYVPDRKLAGDFTVDLGIPSASPVFAEQASDRVMVRLENPPLLASGEVIHVKMFINAAIQAGDPIQIILGTGGHISTTTVLSAKTMQEGHRYSVTLSLAALSGQTVIETREDPGNYQTYGIYHLGDTLISYRQFEDQWTILSYDTYYHFRIQNFMQKKVVTIGSIPLDPNPGMEFTINISVFGVDNIPVGTKNVTVIRKEGNMLLLFDQENQTSYLVYN
ncbi:MAG: fimbrillin family protein [Bacteroidales bacterium]|nr:fimbrillin family protein [Bacteroidales bacterium]MDD4500271.1 fimbrillin family protein [Bacteroidales bacterium]